MIKSVMIELPFDLSLYLELILCLRDEVEKEKESNDQTVHGVHEEILRSDVVRDRHEVAWHLES